MATTPPLHFPVSDEKNPIFQRVLCMNEFQFRDITKTSDENPSVAIFSLHTFKQKKKKLFF